MFNELWKEYNLEKTMPDKKEETLQMIQNGMELDLKLTHIEKELQFDDPYFIGYIDAALLSKDQIHDYKTSTMRSKAQYDDQMLTYSWLYYKIYGKVPTTIVHFLKAKKSVEKIFTVPSILEKEAEIRAIQSHIDKNLDDKGMFPQCGDNPKKCPYFCPYKHHCFSDVSSFITDNNMSRIDIIIQNNYCFLKGNTPLKLIEGLDYAMKYDKKDKYFMQKNSRYARGTPAFDEIGTVHLFMKEYKMFGIGHLNLVKQIIKDYEEYSKQKFEINVVDNRDQEVMNYKISMPDKLYTDKELRDYQIEACDEFMKHRTGFLEIATGGGKTMITAEIIRRLATRTLFIIDRKELLYQTKKEFEEMLGIKVGIIGDGEIDIRDVTCSTVQTLAKNINKFKNYLNNTNLAIVDECLSHSSKIRLADGTEKSIKEIYNDDSITHVLSYNESKQVFEPKKILRKIKSPMKNRWRRLIIKDSNNKIHKITITDNHKIWTKDGYKRVDTIESKDIMKVYLEPKKYRCNKCGRIFEKACQLGGHKVCDFEYNKIGIKCLYIDAESNNIEQIIKKFCYNHDAFLVDIKYAPKNSKDMLYKYNLEIEDNHNYIANNILMSNCHHAKAPIYQKVFKELKNTKYRLGTSGTVYRDDGETPVLFSLIGEIIYKKSVKELQQRGYLMKPEIKFIKLPKPTDIDFMVGNYAEYYDKYVFNNNIRNNNICSLVEENKDKSVLILTKLVGHGRMLNKMIPNSFFIHGSLDSKNRKKIFSDFKNGKIKVLIGTSSIFSEGIDIPSLDVVINATANNGNTRTIQGIGRVLRMNQGKTQAHYYDFIDYGKHFVKASNARIKSLEKEGHEVEVI